MLSLLYIIVYILAKTNFGHWCKLQTYYFFEKIQSQILKISSKNKINLKKSAARKAPSRIGRRCHGFFDHRAARTVLHKNPGRRRGHFEHYFLVYRLQTFGAAVFFRTFVP